MDGSVRRYDVGSCTLQVFEQGDGFVMDLTNEDQGQLRLAFPSWLINQLLRALPRIDAALQQKRGTGMASLIAYPVDEWNVEPVGSGLGVALWVRDARHVDSAFHLTSDDVVALHRELGEAISAAKALAPAPSEGPWPSPLV